DRCRRAWCPMLVERRPDLSAVRRRSPAPRLAVSAVVRGVPSPPAANPPGWIGDAPGGLIRVANPTIVWHLPRTAAATGPAPRGSAPRRSPTRNARPGCPSPPTRSAGLPADRWRRPARFVSARSRRARADVRRGGSSSPARRRVRPLRVMSAAVRLRLSCVLSPAVVVDVPWIGADGTHIHRQRRAKSRPQHVGGLRTPRKFTCPMRDVDQRYLGSAAVLV